MSRCCRVIVIISFVTIEYEKGIPNSIYDCVIIKSLTVTIFFPMKPGRLVITVTKGNSDAAMI